MRYKNIAEFLDHAAGRLADGPIAVILAEDLVEVESTLNHHIGLGFGQVLLFAPAQYQLPDGLDDQVHQIDHEMSRPDVAVEVVNRLASAAPGSWFFYCYNAEYLFFPFCENRSIGEMLAFHTEERRNAMLTYVIDLYAGDLSNAPNAVALDDAYLDRSGYYALARKDDRNHPKERQLSFYGGLRWRHEEHIPETRRRIDRIALFRAADGAKLTSEHLFTDEEYNTYSCPWHHNLTAALVSFRAAKALKLNSGSTFDIETFHWHNSVAFNWQSQQLLDLGLIEPGQWF